MPSAFNALAMIHPVVRYRGYSWIRDSCRDGEEEKKEVQTGSELSLEEEQCRSGEARGHPKRK